MTKQWTHQTLAAGIAAVVMGVGALAVTTSAAGSLNLRERLITPAELPAFGSVLCPNIVDDAHRWVARYASTESLQRNGFVSGLSEPLYSMSFHAQGVTSVAQFASESGARAEVAEELAAARRSPGTFSTFDVPDAPGGYGFTIRRGSLIERDVLFSIGRYVHLTGVTYRIGRSIPVSVPQVADAGGVLYQRLVSE